MKKNSRMVDVSGSVKLAFNKVERLARGSSGESWKFPNEISKNFFLIFDNYLPKMVDNKIKNYINEISTDNCYKMYLQIQ